MQFYKHHKFQVFAIDFEFFLCYILLFFLLNKKSANSLCLIFVTTFLFTSFAFLTSALSTAINEYIFDFNPTNALIMVSFINKIKEL